jgi:deoxycytidine triphosphate deaminase
MLGNVKLRELIENGTIGITPQPKWPDDYGETTVHLRVGCCLYIVPFWRRLLSLLHIRRLRWDPRQETVTELWKRVGKKVVLKEGESIWLSPFSFVVGETLEHVRLPYEDSEGFAWRGQFTTRTANARGGVGGELSAPIIEPGTNHRITFELHVIGPFGVRLHHGADLFNFSVGRVEGVVAKVQSRTNGQVSPIREMVV